MALARPRCKPNRKRSVGHWHKNCIMAEQNSPDYFWDKSLQELQEMVGGNLPGGRKNSGAGEVEGYVRTQKWSHSPWKECTKKHNNRRSHWYVKLRLGKFLRFKNSANSLSRSCIWKKILWSQPRRPQRRLALVIVSYLDWCYHYY